MPELIKKVSTELGIDAAATPDDAKGSQAIKRILSGMANAAGGLAELRNLYGSDHGRSQAPPPLAERHANLAIGCAHTYCQFLLETRAARENAASRAC